MVDMDKISRAVKNTVKNIMKEEGNKSKIDTQKECDKLADYLNGSASQFNQHEIDYLNELMDEFVKEEKSKKTKEAQKEADNAITKDTKTLVKQIKRQQLDKKKIDTDVEARDLATLLNNSNRDLNAADLEYIKNLLKESGYERYIPSESEQQNTESQAYTNAVEPTGKSSTEPVEKTKNKTEEKPNDKSTKPSEGEKGADSPKKAEKNENGSKSQSPEPESTPQTVAKKQKKYEIKNARIAESIADDLEIELDKNNPDPLKIKKHLGRAKNCGYTFFTAINEESKEGKFMATVFGKAKNRRFVNLRDVIQPMEHLLKMAEDMNLSNTEEYKTLNDFCLTVRTNNENGRSPRPTDEEIKRFDKAIVDLCEKMKPNIIISQQ